MRVLCVTPERFLEHCKSLWHVGPAGSWPQIARTGLRTAEQLILQGDLDEEARKDLLTRPRRETTRFTIDGEEVALRDQGRLSARKDLATDYSEGFDEAQWIGLLNRRVYLFCDGAKMRTFLKKYVERDGAQDVLVISPLRLLQAVGPQIEITAPSTGAIARRTGSQKSPESFLSIARSPDRKPAEVTIVDGLDDLGAIVRAERHHADGSVEPLERSAP